MKLSHVNKSDLLKQATDLLIICVPSSSDKKSSLFPPQMTEIEQSFGMAFTQEAKNRGFLGTLGEEFLTPIYGQGQARTVALLGTSCDDDPAECFLKIGAACSMLATKLKVKNARIFYDGDDCGSLLFEGALLALYKFNKYKAANNEKTLDELTFCTNLSDEKGRALAAEAEIKAGAIMTARDLINEPPCVITPSTMADHAVALAKKYGFKAEVYDEKWLAKEKMNLLLAVGAAMGSVNPPRLVKLSYGDHSQGTKVCLVGKGITFDTGGLDLKPAAGMLHMKYDMSGAACVLGTMMAIAQLKPKISVTAYMCCAENGVSALAYHPGDIIKSRAGLYVEIDNTDAEGRLVLADALAYAQEIDKPEVLINVATLTGAVRVALGLYCAGLFSNTDDLSAKILASGQACGESFWRLPLDKRLLAPLKSSIADLKNVGGPYGGAITAAVFLQKFIKAPTQWAHLDIAGPAFADKSSYYLSEGGTGFGVRTLCDYLCTGS